MFNPYAMVPSNEKVAPPSVPPNEKVTPPSTFGRAYRSLRLVLRNELRIAQGLIRDLKLAKRRLFQLLIRLDPNAERTSVLGHSHQSEVGWLKLSHSQMTGELRQARAYVRSLLVVLKVAESIKNETLGPWPKVEEYDRVLGLLIPHGYGVPLILQVIARLPTPTGCGMRDYMEQKLKRICNEADRLASKIQVLEHFISSIPPEFGGFPETEKTSKR